MMRYLIYSLRIRRVEYRIAELPIFFIPALLTISHVRQLHGAVLWEGLTAFLFLFAFGDLLNCLADRELDAIYKPHLTEAVYGIGIRGVIGQAVLSALGAIGLTTHVAWMTGRWILLPMVVVGLFVAWAYSVEPVRLKGRGVCQLLFYWLGLFVAPMMFAGCLFVDVPPLSLVFVSAAFSCVQTGVILINTAEDFPEDIQMAVRTAIVALGLRKGVALAFWLALIGTVLLLASLIWIHFQLDGPGWRVTTLLPLFVATVYCVVCVRKLTTSLVGATEQDAIQLVKLSAKRVPIWMTSVAVTTLIASIAISPIVSERPNDLARSFHQSER